MTDPIAVSQRARDSAQALRTYLSIRGLKDGEIDRAFARFEAETRKDERERCAGECDAYARGPFAQKVHGRNIAAAIRNLGEG